MCLFLPVHLHIFTNTFFKSNIVFAFTADFKIFEAGFLKFINFENYNYMCSITHFTYDIFCRLMKSKLLLTSAEICDIYKGLMLVICTYLMFYIDINMMYHLIKSQSVIKLYIFYNMLEVGDRLFSAFGQDIIDALLWTATVGNRKKQKGGHLGVIPHLIFALAYLCILLINPTLS